MSAEAFAKIMSQGAEAPEVEPTRAQERAAPEPDSRNDVPNFGGEMKAVFREGLKDLQNVVLHAFPDSIHGVEEPGTPTNPTQQMVTDAVLKDDRSDRSAGAIPSQSVSLQDILDDPSPLTPPVQEQQNEREQGREM